MGGIYREHRRCRTHPCHTTAAPLAGDHRIVRGPQRREVFGTADRLGSEVRRAASGATYLILDLKRVTMIDASGALMLERLQHRLRETGTRLLLAHISNAGPLGRALHAAGVFAQKHHEDWFADADHALEWAEQQLLLEARVEDVRREIRISEFALMVQLSQAQLAAMKPCLDRRLFPARATLFREGDPVDRVYLLARGAISIARVHRSTRAHRPDLDCARRRKSSIVPLHHLPQEHAHVSA